ncbi:uncharacterized protein V6R79_016396 [Siganus canaliculatus]
MPKQKRLALSCQFRQLTLEETLNFCVKNQLLCEIDTEISDDNGEEPRDRRSDLLAEPSKEAVQQHVSPVCRSCRSKAAALQVVEDADDTSRTSQTRTSQTRTQTRPSEQSGCCSSSQNTRGRTLDRDTSRGQASSRGHASSRGRGQSVGSRGSRPAPDHKWYETDWEPNNIPFTGTPGPINGAATLDSDQPVDFVELLSDELLQNIVEQTNRYLATGDSYRTIANSFRVCVSSVSRIVPDVASAIWDSLVGRDRRVFNYRLSRARLVVECAFGVLASQWRLYRRALEVQPDVAEICVKATCVLHNFLRLTTSTPVVRGASTGADMELLPGLGRVAANNSGREAIRVRDTFSSYFSAEGAVQWQASI